MSLPVSAIPATKQPVLLASLPNGEKVATFTLAEILTATQGTLVLNEAYCPATLFAPLTDTRGLSTTSFPEGIAPVFIPLVGETFDGHHFIPQLAEQGVSLCFANNAYLAESTTQTWLASNPLLTIISVPDTLEAFQGLARYHRQRLVGTKIVGLTGSSGKTTVKELLAFGLASGFLVQATEKNFNNDIGVAKTLLAIAPETQVAIVEMGMRGLGEIARLAHTALPDIGLLLNVGPAHIGRLGSLEAIAQAKCELAEGVGKILIANADDPYITAQLTLQGVAEPVERRAFTVTQAEQLQALPNGCFQFFVEGTPFHTTLPGEHQVKNWLAVIQVAKALGLPLAQLADQLSQFQSVAGRFESVALGGNAVLINDAYNANPSSMRASLQAFLKPASASVSQLLIVGTMQELGEFEQGYHQELLAWLVQQAKESALRGLVFVGHEVAGYEVFLRQLLKETGVENTFSVLTAETVEAVAEALPAWIVSFRQPAEQSVEWLLKGSRSHGLERLVPVLKTVYEA